MEISIIIPAYNADKSLPETIKSIVSSTHQDFAYEVIVVDDGSVVPAKDTLVQHFESELHTGKVKYIYQENGGVSVARNTGLENASGKYITFCDADDLVSFDYLDVLYELSQENPQADIIEFKFKTYRAQVENILNNNGQVTISKEGLHSAEEALNNSSQMFVWLVMCRMVKAELAQSLRFPLGIRYCEDLIYLYGLYERAQYVYSSDKNLYRYQIGHVSAISKVTLSECDYIDQFLAQKNINNSDTLLCVKAHLFYMYHSAAKRHSNAIQFCSVMWRKRVGLLNWVKLYKSKKITKRKFQVGVLPFLYYLVFRLKQS